MFICFWTRVDISIWSISKPLPFKRMKSFNGWWYHFIYRSLWDSLQGLWQSNWRYSSPKADPVRVDGRRGSDVHFEGNCIAETTSEIQPSKCCQVRSMAIFSLSEKEYIGMFFRKSLHTIKHICKIELYFVVFFSIITFTIFWKSGFCMIKQEIAYQLKICGIHYSQQWQFISVDMFPICVWHFPFSIKKYQKRKNI